MMNRIVWHHTGGGHLPNDTDRAAYHRLIDGDGRVHAGIHSIEANAPGARLVTGRYAAHTGGLNSGSIGLAVCAMAGGVWANPRASAAFPTPAQIDAVIAETVGLCRTYGIQPVRAHVLSHAEVPLTLGVVQKGKWDFDYQIRKTAGRDPIAIGDELRAEVAARLVVAPTAPVASRRTVLRQGASGDAVRVLQRALRIKADGLFGPKTRAAVLSFQRARQLLPDGVVGPMTWAALGL
ncbi:N-acetylmuramoyl-L-alanine amidase [Nostoc phage Nsp-JY21]